MQGDLLKAACSGLNQQPLSYESNTVITTYHQIIYNCNTYEKDDSQIDRKVAAEWLNFCQLPISCRICKVVQENSDRSVAQEF